MSGPCLCGDPYCPRCFPQPRSEPDDPDEAYEITRQKETDDAACEKDPGPAEEPAAPSTAP